MTEQIRWTPRMEDAFVRLWPAHGANWDGWQEALGTSRPPSRDMLYKQASRLGVHRKKGPRPYTDEEERELESLVERWCQLRNRSFGSATRKIDAIHQRRVYRERRERERAKKSSC